MRWLVVFWLVAAPYASAQTNEESSGEGDGPSPSQIHIGHVMTSMNGTPDRVGLLEILIQEAEIAAQHAALAARDEVHAATRPWHGVLTRPRAASSRPACTALRRRRADSSRGARR